MIFVDDFLTRRWWDEKPYPNGLGINICFDYKEMTIQEELATLKRVKAMGVPFKIFVIGYVLEMAQMDPEIRDALRWCVDNGIELCGHGYFHTEREHNEGYVGYAEKVYSLLQEYQAPPYSWRYPREVAVNTGHVEKLFKIEKVDLYLDEELLTMAGSLEVLRGHEHHNAVVHSLYLTRPIRKFYPSLENVAKYEKEKKEEEERYLQKQIKAHTTSEGYALNSLYSKLIPFLHTKVPMGRVLDIGCNTGYESLMLQHEGRTVVGIDAGPDYVAKARERGVEAYAMDMHRVDQEKVAPESFDCVYMNNSLEHAYNPAIVLRHVYRALRPGGVFVACVPSDYKNPGFYSGDWDFSLHVWRPTPEELRDAVTRVGFRVEELQEIDSKAMFGLENPSSNNLYEVLVGKKP